MAQLTKFACPNCGSDNIQSLPVVYNSGTIDSRSITRYNVNDVEKTTSGSTSNRLAQSVAPPYMMEVSWKGVIICGFFAICGIMDGSIGIGILFGLAAAYFYNNAKEAKDYNENEYPAKYNAWKESFICHRCGNVFIPK